MPIFSCLKYLKANLGMFNLNKITLAMSDFQGIMGNTSL